jgi:hypothetical protein
MVIAQLRARLLQALKTQVGDCGGCEPLLLRMQRLDSGCSASRLAGVPASLVAHTSVSDHLCAQSLLAMFPQKTVVLFHRGTHQHKELPCQSKVVVARQVSDPDRLQQRSFQDRKSAQPIRRPSGQHPNQPPSDSFQNKASDRLHPIAMYKNAFR